VNLVRKVVISVYSTLDGIIQPIDWTGHYPTPEHAPYARQQLFEADALLMGRETYESFAGAWSARTSTFDAPGAEGYVDRINMMPKYVASTTLQEPLTWNNSTLIKGDVAQAVAEMKRQPGLNLLTYGAGPVAHTLIQNGLVDEIQIWLYPVIAGNGVRLFTGTGDMPYLQLRDARRFQSGIMILTYEPENRSDL
jgi:dihydrofolate reductase